MWAPSIITRAPNVFGKKRKDFKIRSLMIIVVSMPFFSTLITTYSALVHFGQGGNDRHDHLKTAVLLDMLISKRHKMQLKAV